ncbi:hypothetical protein, partial [Novipirellula herctigrandis]
MQFTFSNQVRLVAAACLLAGSFFNSSTKGAANGADKVVLANLDRYDAYLKIRTTRREIKPGKASVLVPRSFPVTIELWAGNTRRAWKTQTITKPGTYGLNFKRGNWELTELKKRTTSAKPVVRSAARPSSRIVRRHIIDRPVRRLPLNADRNRWSPLARAAYAAGTIYQFVRDEQDRELLRHLLIRAREDEDWEQLEDWIRDCKIPELYKDDLRDAFDDLSRLSDAQWDDVVTADEEDWDAARADLGDLMSEAEWDNVTADFEEIDSVDFWQDDVDLDLNDLNFRFGDDAIGSGDHAIDFGGRLDFQEDLDVGDFGIGYDNYDLGGYD